MHKKKVDVESVFKKYFKESVTNVIQVGSFENEILQENAFQLPLQANLPALQFRLA